MCGIAGFIRFSCESREEDRRTLERMVSTLVHRGPDSAGYGVFDGAAMGMRRLAIIDLAGGEQPVFNETRTLWTVFNGEIYNFKELREELRSCGHIFTTHTDTEVIVHGYEQWGTGLFQRLNGMFAIALHDISARKAIFARDHLGIKPFYYCWQKDRFIFGSEIKAILKNGVISRDLNHGALADFLSWEYVPGRETMFSAVKKLLPGEFISIDLAAPACNPVRFWDIPEISEHPVLSSEEWEEKILTQIRKSTQMQMISDVPLGAFLSGGVDSSLIAACMGRVETFSIGFDDPSYNELNWARKVANHLGVSHFDEVIKPDVVSLFDTLMNFMEDPVGDFSIFPTYLVSRLARKHVTVALSGDGGDELFAGYDSYLAQEKARIFEKVPLWIRRNAVTPITEAIPPASQKKGFRNKLKRFVEGCNYDSRYAHTRWRIFMGEALRDELFTPEMRASITEDSFHHIDELFGRSGARDPLARSLYVDVKSYLCDNILTKVDRMSMAVSLETRVPFLDKDMVELAFSVPSNMKLEGNETKAILKRVAARLVPKSCVYRPKEGFSIPIKNWLNNEFAPLIEDYLGKEAIQKAGIFNPSTIERLKNEHQSGRANHSHLLWSLIVFHDWQKRWV